MRRRTYCAVAAGAVAGCLRLEGDEEDETSSGEPDEPAADTEPVATSADSIELREAWERSEITATTTVDGGVFGAVDDTADDVSTERLERFTETGDSEWQSAELPGGESFTLENHGKAIRNDEVVVAVAHDGHHSQSETAKLYAYDADSGDQQWVHDTDGDRGEVSVRGLTGDGNAVYYCVRGASGTGDEQEPSVRALDTETGDVLWAEEFESGFRTGAVVYGDRLYTSTTNEIQAFDTATGELVEERELGTGFDGFAPSEDTLYLGQNELLAYDPADRDIQWRREPDRFTNADLTYREGTIYAGTGTGWVFAHDASGGDRLWDERIDGSVSALHQTGSDLLWVLNDETTVTAIRATTGEVLYQDDVGTRQIAAVGRTVLFGGRAYEVESE